jgi:Domain of Unknown Function (DUF748)
MKIANTRLKKIIIILICVIVVVVAVVIAFISPITKYIVEKYDEKWTGRKITMDWAYVNPFTGYVYLSNLKMHESKSDSIFFSAKGLSANFAVRKLFSKTYEVSQLTLDHPRGIIIQNKTDLNLADLIKKLTPKTDTTIAGVHFSILNIKIKNGEFYYRENQVPINYFIKEVNYEGTGNRWDADTIAGTFSFKSGIGSGDMKGNFTINTKTDDYRYAVVIQKYDLNIIGQYLKDLTNYGTFSANLDADLKATGNFRDEQDVTAKGILAINDFHFGRNPDDDYMSFDKFVLAINEMSPLKHIYLYDSVSLTHPYFKYELYDKSDNLQTMFGKGGANVYSVASDPGRFNLIIEIARYVKVMARNFFQSYYKINRLAIYKGDFKFNDYTLSEKFSTDISPLYFIADSIDKNHNRVEASFKSGIQPYGNVTVGLSVNPKDTGDFDMQYHFQKFPAAMFNPYLISYTSFPLDRGTIELKGKWTVRNGDIQSQNHLLLIDPRVTKRIKNKNASWLPLPLIFSFVREYGNIIDYEIPITGSLKSPTFHLKDVISDILGNIFIKPVTTPYRMEVKDLENEIEKSLTLKWAMQQTVLQPEQEKFAGKMSGFLEDNPQASITVYPIQYAAREKEYILFFEAKKKYFLHINQNIQQLSEEDSEKVNNMSIKDSLFIEYVNKQVSDTLLFTMQDKCSKLVGSTLVNARFKKLNADRESAFRFCFKKKEVQSRIQMHVGENTIPYNGFSFYKIEYTGELPKSLTKAYEKLQELNDEAPRKKYKRESKKLTESNVSLNQ